MAQPTIAWVRRWSHSTAHSCVMWLIRPPHFGCSAAGPRHWQRRITGKDKDATLLILWLDEATSLLGHSKLGPELVGLLEGIAQQYRKRSV